MVQFLSDFVATNHPSCGTLGVPDRHSTSPAYSEDPATAGSATLRPVGNTRFGAQKALAFVDSGDWFSTV